MLSKIKFMYSKLKISISKDLAITISVMLLIIGIEFT